MAFADPVQAAARALAGARTAGQFQAAIGTTTIEIAKAYEIAGKLPIFGSYTPKQGRRELDAARRDVEAAYKSVSQGGPIALSESDAANKRRVIGKAWGAIASIRGATDSFAQWDGVDILGQAILEAPGLILSTSKAFIQGTGEVASGLVGSVLKGFWPLLLMLGIVALLAVAGKKRGLL
jgi:hypothetical protein